jgi:hypothetical protein
MGRGWSSPESNIVRVEFKWGDLLAGKMATAADYNPLVVLNELH